MTHYKFLLIVQCEHALDEQKEPQYLHKHNGLTLLQTFNKRIFEFSHLKTIFVLNQPHAQTEQAAKKLGWTVLIKKHKTFKYKMLLNLLNARTLYFADIRYPFTDPELWQKMITIFMADKPDILTADPYNGFSPLFLMKNNPIQSLQVACKLCSHRIQNLPKHIYAEAKQHMPIPHFKYADYLQADTVDSKILAHFGGPNLNLETAIAAANRDAFNSAKLLTYVHEKLASQLEHANAPHLANVHLLKFEEKNHIETVKSFPMDVTFSLTDRCNANCIFCNYPAEPKINKANFSLQDFQKITWLKYTWKAGLGGGLGEPMIHPEFLAIYQYLKTHYPHLILRTITNGLALNTKYSQAFTGHLAKINISLNAATRETWEKLMRVNGFEKVCAAIEELAQMKKEMNTDKPEIILTMVVNKMNICEAVQFVELAKKLGAQKIVFSHFNKLVMQKSELAIENSMYFNKQECDYWMGLAVQKANKLNLGVINYLLPFSVKESGCFQGIRTITPRQQCYASWRTAYFSKNRFDVLQPAMIFCCANAELKMDYDAKNLTEIEMTKLWNHPTLQYIRRTVNTKEANPFCHYCRTVDQDDPENFDKSNKIITDLQNLLMTKLG